MTLNKLTLTYTVCLALSIIAVQFGYRQWVEIPTLKQEISRFQQRELSTLTLALSQQQQFFSHPKL